MASVATEERCIIISTHQVRDLDNLIDTVIVLDEGVVALNQPVDAITEKLVFKTVDVEKAPTAIYGESSLRGFTGVFHNANGEASKLDMEILFNSVLAQKSTIQQVFNNK